ncbi:MAG: T9SS type A sorting domain-containing protein [bacterium]
MTDSEGRELSEFEPTIPEGMAVIDLAAFGDELLLASYRVTYLPYETQRAMLIQKYSEDGVLIEEGYCIADTGGSNTLAMGTAFRRVGDSMEAAMLVMDYDTTPPSYAMHVGVWPQQRQVSWNLDDAAYNIYRLYDMAKNDEQEMVLAVVRDDSTVTHEHLLFWACDSIGMPRGNPLTIALPDSQSATSIMMTSLGQSFYAAYSYGNLTMPDAPLRIWLTAFMTEDILPAGGAEIMPQDFQISAWPNPFNSSVSLAYYLPASGQVTLSVYDLLGRQVEMLVQETQVPGMHQIAWRPERQASGTYFIRMQSPKHSVTQKVILLK